MVRHILLMIALTRVAAMAGQPLDSIRVFHGIPELAYTTSVAETAAWRMIHEHRVSTTLREGPVDGINELLRTARPTQHAHRPLPGLSHLGVAYTGKRAHVFCIADSAGVVIDLTARREIRMDGPADRQRLRTVLSDLGW